MGIISWVILGLIAGYIAKKIMARVSPANEPTQPQGCLVTTALGVGGAALGGIVASAVFGVSVDKFFSITTWLVSILGAMALLGIFYYFQQRRTERGDNPSVIDSGDHRQDRH